MENNTQKWILIGAVGCLVIIICVLISLFAGFGGLMWLGLQEPEGINIRGEVPGRVEVGEAFTITVTLENLAEETQTLDSIDIDISYLEGVTIHSSDPNFLNREEMSILGLEFETFVFTEAIRPGDTLTVEFSAEATQAGVFEGQIDVCFNLGAVCKGVPAYTVIEE